MTLIQHLGHCHEYGTVNWFNYRLLKIDPVLKKQANKK